MPNYRFFSVLHPEEATDPLFPVLNSNFVPVFTEDDGNEIESVPVQGMFVLKDSGENAMKIFSGSKDLKGTLWITSQRVVVVCRNFDQVKWDRTNTANTAFFGIGTELAWHLGEKAFHKIKSSGKAMASHVYFPWIESIGYRPGQGKKDPANIRIGIYLALESGNLPLALELQFDSVVDTADLVRNIRQRMAKWYVNGPVELTEEQRQRATREAEQLTLQRFADGRKYSTLHSVALRVENTPSSITERTRLANERARVARAAVEARIATFRSQISECRPYCELVEATAEGREVFTSELGIVIARGSGVKAIPSETTLFHFLGDLHGTYVANRETGAPAKEGIRNRLHEGKAQLLITNKRVVVVTKGFTAAGDLSGPRAGVLIVSTPIEKIDVVGRFKSIVPGRTELDLLLRSSDASWGGTFARSITAERASDETWTNERQDLEEVASRIAAAIATVRGLPSPRLGEENNRFAYLLT